jgi:3-dehydroquinate synthetase
MVDAAIGGKVGVDLPEGKNLVGAFYPPRLLLIDPIALDTLPTSEWRHGMAEVVKAALIGDPELWEQLRAAPARWAQPPEGPERLELLERAIAVKARIVERDPWETQGEREQLNLGHTFGHAFERLSGYRVPHGEAVAAGMRAAAAPLGAAGPAGDAGSPAGAGEAPPGTGIADPLASLAVRLRDPGDTRGSDRGDGD